MPYSDDAFAGVFVFIVTRGLQELSRITGRSFAGIQTAAVAALLSLGLALLINSAMLKSPDTSGLLKALADFLIMWVSSAGVNYAVKQVASK